METVKFGIFLEGSNRLVSLNRLVQSTEGLVLVAERSIHTGKSKAIRLAMAFGNVERPERFTVS
jgi:hypothetical protein